MEIRLNENMAYNNDGIFDKRSALIDVGVNAAICFRENCGDDSVKPWKIRNSEDDNKLLVRGFDTILSDHTSPSDHVTIRLDFSSIPKALCMVLHDQRMYNSCERSLRYTEVKPSDYISEQETFLYNKWLVKIQEFFKNNYYDYFMKISNNKKITFEKTIKKVAQEYSRYMVSVFTPTSLMYTVPFAEINKICLYMQDIIRNPKDSFEIMLVPYMNEFISKLKKLNVLVLNDDVFKYLDQDNLEKILNRHRDRDFKNDNIMYNNNKSISLNLFANRNKFSGINMDNQYGVNVSYNHMISFACLGQEQRHRTVDCEMMVPSNYEFYVPKFLTDCLKDEWCRDMLSIKGRFPQGQLVKVNMVGSVRNIIDFVAKERACERAQQEIEELYREHIIPDIYNNSLEFKDVLAPYVKTKRCQYTDYNCPNKCGHIRMNREF